MAKKCCVPECFSYLHTHILVHRFPTNIERAELWRQLVDNPQLETYPVEELNKRYSICTNHFRMDDYKSFTRKLKNGAVPTLNLPNFNEDKASLIAKSLTLPSCSGVKRNRNRLLSDESCPTTSSTVSSESGISSPSNLSTDFEDIPQMKKITRSFKKAKNCSRAYHKYLYIMDRSSSDNSDCECEAMNRRSESCSPAHVTKKNSNTTNK